jgi:hypothetical protein
MSLGLNLCIPMTQSQGTVDTYLCRHSKQVSSLKLITMMDTLNTSLLQIMLVSAKLHGLHTHTNSNHLTLSRVKTCP